MYPERLAGDSAYGSAEMLNWLDYEQGIEPHVSVFDKSARKDGTFSREHFTYDHEAEVYFCPAGKILTTKVAGGGGHDHRGRFDFAIRVYGQRNGRLERSVSPKG